MHNYTNRKVKTGCEPVFKKLEQVLKKEGFNIVSEIKIHDRLKEKFQVEFPKFFILGTRHPDFLTGFSGSRTEENDSKMQCNFVVYQISENETEIGCYNPVALNGNSNKADWKNTEKQIIQKLDIVIRQIQYS